MKLGNSILEDFKENVTAQFVGVITFGFGVTAFYAAINTFIITSQIQLTPKDIVFIFFSFIGYLFSFNLLKNKIDIKIKLLKYVDFIVNILGFVLMFVPIIVIYDQTSNPIVSYEYMIIQNSIISLIISIFIFLTKSILKILIKSK